MKKLARPIANPDVVLREEFDDWAVLFNPDTADALGINPIGVVIWKLMDGTRNLDDIIKTVGDQYSEVPQGAPDEVSGFVAQLQDLGFVGVEANELES